MFRRPLFTLCGVFLFIIIASTAFAEDLSKLATITVEGRARVMVAPNVAGGDKRPAGSRSGGWRQTTCGLKKR
ncbi:MAG: hypothetical protein JRF41_12725 [Deltaproteobacteria bacterium]|nr:hypothetical protein [Deltaproteobacteria bacterium]